MFSWVFLFLIVVIDMVYPFASWFASDFCNLPLKVGEIIMNHEAKYSEERKVEIYRYVNDKDIKVESGGLYYPGEELTCVLRGPEVGELVFESNMGIFEDGGCKQRRSSLSSPFIVIPSDALGTIEIWAGIMLQNFVMFTKYC